MTRTSRKGPMFVTAFFAVVAIVACDQSFTPVAPVVEVPLQDVTVICPSSQPAPYCTVCEVYNVFGTCAETECAESGGWITNPNCDPFDCSQGYWWCEYAPPTSSKDTIVPVFFAECDTGVERGQAGSCSVRSEANADFVDWEFTVNSQTATSADPAIAFSVEEGVGEPYQGGLNGDTHTWSGKFIAKTAVRFHITALGKSYTAAATFEPVRRSSWTAWVAPVPQESYEYFAQMANTPIQPGVTVGLFGYDEDTPFLEMPLSNGDFGGPNGPLWYASSVPQFSPRVYINPRLANSGSFFLLQDGLNGNCNSADASAFRERVRRHEGSTLDTQSHWAIYRDALQGSWRYASLPSISFESMPHNVVERQVFPESSGGAAMVRYESWNQGWIPFRNALNTQQVQFDAVDGSIVNSWGACNVVWEQ